MFEIFMKTHIAFILILALLIIRNLYVLYTEENFIQLAKKVRFPTPIFHALIAITFFTGTLIITMFKTFDILVVLMIASTLFIMIAEIKRYKKIRVIRSKDYKEQEEFKVFAKKIYFIDLGIIFALFVLSKVLS